MATLQITQPKESTDIKSNRDCMIRAIALATGKPYSQVHQLLYKHGWRATRGSSKTHWVYQMEQTLTDLGFIHQRHYYPATKGKKRMTAHTMPTDKVYILRMAKHVACLDNGVLLDTWDSRNKCVYVAWEVVKV